MGIVWFGAVAAFVLSVVIARSAADPTIATLSMIGVVVSVGAVLMVGSILAVRAL